MKKNISLAFLSTVLGLAVACNNPKSTNTAETDSTIVTTTDTTTIVDPDHSSKNALDWFGLYSGTIPCADCPGIKTTIILNSDETYSYEAEYLERNTTVQDSGKFMWHNNGSVVHLKGKDFDGKYKVGENVLIQLDGDEKPITGPNAEKYNLTKVQ